MRKYLLPVLMAFVLTSYRHPQNLEKSNLFIFYPSEKQGHNFFLFLNKKKIARLSPGQRLIYSFDIENSVKVTILETEYYTEPRTLSKNTRTVGLKKGKDFYFELNGKKAELHYIIKADEGREEFESASTLKPASYSYAAKDSIFLK